MDPHMDVYPPGGEDVNLPAGRVFVALLCSLVAWICAVLIYAARICAMG